MDDVFLYNGDITREGAFKFFELVKATRKGDECTLVLVTAGGDPDAAYLIGRYLQRTYESLKVLVSGYCKSAGTLLATAAQELIFADHGELGPLDIQVTMKDEPTGTASGLNISEAFLALEQRSLKTYTAARDKILDDSDSVISFGAASTAAAQIISSLYGPIFTGINAGEVGSSARAMRIVGHYGERLDSKWNNLKPEALDLLVLTYPDHGCVIDFLEAQSLFERVRGANQDELAMIAGLGDKALLPEEDLTVERVEFISGPQD